MTVEPIQLYDINNDTTPWTTARLIDELFIDLIEVRGRDEKYGYISKYRGQAEYWLYRIPVRQPTPIFIIEYDDLTERIKLELGELDKSVRHHVIIEAISRIFEDVEINAPGVDKRYFLLSVRKLLKWKLVV